MKPSPLVISCLRQLAFILPTWRIVPSQDVIDAAVRDPEKKKKVFSLLNLHTRTRQLYIGLIFNHFECNFNNVN